MDQAFDAGLDFDESAVREEIDDFAFDACSWRIFLFDLVPRIGFFLLQSKSDAPFIFIDTEDHDFQFLAEVDHFGRMFDPLPCHIGNMQEAVDAIQVQEYAEVGDIFDNPFANIAFCDISPALLLSWKFSQLQAVRGGKRRRFCGRY